MTEREALKLALEALEIVNREMLTLRDELAERGGRPSQGYHQLLWDSSHKVYTDTAIPAAEAIREALAQPEQEPVAWDNCRSEKQCQSWCGNSACGSHWSDTTPPQRKPLSDEEILHRVDTHVGGPSPSYPLDNSDWLNFARAIEAAHGIKE